MDNVKATVENVLTNNVYDGREGKIIFSGIIAKYLARNGCTVIDFKPHKDNPIRSLPIFLKDVKLLETIQLINKARRQRRAEREEEEIVEKPEMED